MDAANTALLVNELEEFVTYSFVVATETSAGIGPYSDTTVTATTFQDGMGLAAICFSLLVLCAQVLYRMHENNVKYEWLIYQPSGITAVLYLSKYPVVLPRA